MAITENKKDLNGHISWVGDGNNVLHDLLLAGVILGHDVKYATPEGMEPNQEVVDRAVEIGNKTGAKVVATNDPIEAVSDAGVIYTDIFVSMGEEHLENKFEAFQGFQVNEELVSKKKDELNKKNNEIKNKFKEISKLINNKTFTFNKESKENGELYGSIKPKEITNLII
jgi:ornithine carbamoyltransferase